MFRSPPRRRKAKDITGDKHIARALHAILQRPGMPVNVITNQASGRCRIGTRKASMALHPRRGHVPQAAGAIQHPQRCALPSPLRARGYSDLEGIALQPTQPSRAASRAAWRPDEDVRRWEGGRTARPAGTGPGLCRLFVGHAGLTHHSHRQPAAGVRGVLSVPPIGPVITP